MRLRFDIKAPKGCGAKNVRSLRAKTQQYVDRVLARDQDWDFAYLLEMMRYKISRMRKCLGAGTSSDYAKMSRQMKDVEDALGRLIDDDYFHKPLQALNEKYGVEYGFVKGPKYTTLELVPLKGRKFGVADRKQREREYRRILRQSEKDRDRDLDIAFVGMRDNVLCWWD